MVEHPGGLLVGLSGLWMTLFYPGTNSTAGAGALLLYILRLLFGSGMVFSIVYGFIAIRRGDMIRHRAWMTRAYAIGLGAGTQALTLGASLDWEVDMGTLINQRQLETVQAHVEDAVAKDLATLKSVVESL